MGELDLRLSSTELTEWMAFEKIYGPLGKRGRDIQMADLAAILINTNRPKGRKATKAMKILESWGCGRSKPQTGEEMLALLKDINQNLGGEYVGRSDS